MFSTHSGKKQSLMTLKIGLDVQFIKTDTAGRDFRESRVVTVQNHRRKGDCNLQELKKVIQRHHFKKLQIKWFGPKMALRNFNKKSVLFTTFFNFCGIQSMLHGSQPFIKEKHLFNVFSWERLIKRKG